jgi:hypothetical protein
VPGLVRPSRRRILIGATVAVIAVAFVGAWNYSRQLPSGDGWQLLARQRGLGDRNAPRLLTDQVGLDAAWTALLIHSNPPDVDFGRSVVVWLTPLGTVSCPSRLDEIRFDPSARVVDGSFSLGLTMNCRSPSVSDSFLVAIDRTRLPPTPYQVRILGPDPPGVMNGQLDVGPSG